MVLGMAAQTPEDVEAMRRLAAAGWGRRRMASGSGCGRGFLAHRGNADVVRQELELELEKGIRVSLRTMERAVEPWRGELRHAVLATVRFETPLCTWRC